MWKLPTKREVLEANNNWPHKITYNTRKTKEEAEEERAMEMYVRRLLSTCPECDNYVELNDVKITESIMAYLTVRSVTCPHCGAEYSVTIDWSKSEEGE